MGPRRTSLALALLALGLLARDGRRGSGTDGGTSVASVPHRRGGSGRRRRRARLARRSDHGSGDAGGGSAGAGTPGGPAPAASGDGRDVGRHRFGGHRLGRNGDAARRAAPAPGAPAATVGRRRHRDRVSASRRHPWRRQPRPRADPPPTRPRRRPSRADSRRRRAGDRAGVGAGGGPVGADPPRGADAGAADAGAGRRRRLRRRCPSVDVGALAGLPALGSIGAVASGVPDGPAAARALLSTGTGRSVAVILALLARHPAVPRRSTAGSTGATRSWPRRAPGLTSPGSGERVRSTRRGVAGLRPPARPAVRPAARSSSRCSSSPPRQGRRHRAQSVAIALVYLVFVAGVEVARRLAPAPGGRARVVDGAGRRRRGRVRGRGDRRLPQPAAVPRVPRRDGGDAGRVVPHRAQARAVVRAAAAARARRGRRRRDRGVRVRRRPHRGRQRGHLPAVRARAPRCSRR